MIGSNRLNGLIMLFVTILIIVLSFLPSVVFSNYSESTGDSIDFPMFGDGFRGSESYPSTDKDYNMDEQSNMALIFYFSWTFQIIGWIVYSFFRIDEKQRENQFLKIFSSQNILYANLVTFFGLLLWGFQRDDDQGLISLEWGYYVILVLMLFTTAANLIIWYQSQNTITITEGKDVSENSKSKENGKLIESNKFIGLSMLIVTLLTILLSFLPSIVFSSASYFGSGGDRIVFPMFGDGIRDGQSYPSTEGDLNMDEQSNMALIFYFSWMFQIIGWIVYSFLQVDEKQRENQFLKIFSNQNILYANLVTFFGLLLWGFQRDDDHGVISLEWGYYVILGLMLVPTVTNSFIWYQNQNTVSNTESRVIPETSVDTSKTKTYESLDSTKLSRKERKENERKAKKEAKLLATQEAEILKKQEIENQMRNRVETFRKVVMRSAKLKIAQLATMLEMNQNDLLKWLYDLPDEFGFVINEEIIEFDTVKIGDSIDKLLYSFDKAEQAKDGKLLD